MTTTLFSTTWTKTESGKYVEETAIYTASVTVAGNLQTHEVERNVNGYKTRTSFAIMAGTEYAAKQLAKFQAQYS